MIKSKLIAILALVILMSTLIPPAGVFAAPALEAPAVAQQGELQTMTIQPDAGSGDDASIQSLYHNVEFGADPYFFIGEKNNESNISRTIIRFDLSTLPTDIDVVSATLTIWGYSSGADYSDNATNISVYPLIRGISEAYINWDVSAAGNSWQVAGADGAADRESTAIGSVALSATFANDQQVDISFDADIFEQVVRENIGASGFVLRADTELNNAYMFKSMDNATAEQRPRLVIEYYTDAMPPTDIEWVCVDPYPFGSCTNTTPMTPFFVEERTALVGEKQIAARLDCDPLDGCRNDFPVYWRVEYDISWHTDMPSHTTTMTFDAGLLINGPGGETEVAFDESCGTGYSGQCGGVAYGTIAPEFLGTSTSWNFGLRIIMDHPPDWPIVTDPSFSLYLALQPFEQNCYDTYVIPVLDTFIIDPTVETPVGAPTDEQMYTTTEGQLYMIRTQDGPWNDGTDDRYDTAVSWDGTNWVSLGDLSQEAECVIQDPLHQDLMVVFITAASDTFYIRANDAAGQFANNTNDEITPLSYTIGQAYLAEAPDCASQFQYNELQDWILSVDVVSDMDQVLATPDAESSLIAGEWYAIKVYEGTWNEPSGPPRVDMEFVGGEFIGVEVNISGEWQDLTPGSHQVWCQTEDGLITFIQAATPVLWLRVNDQDAPQDFENNSGTLGVAIYHATFDRLEETCEMQFALDNLVRSDSVDAAQENGKTFAFMVGSALTNESVQVENFLSYGLVPGAWYALETTGGPWGYPGAGVGGSLTEYDLAVGESGDPLDHPDEWGALADWPRAECNVASDALGHRLVYFQTPITGVFSASLRVDDDVLWFNNRGQMSWNLYRVINLGVDPGEGCDYTFDVANQVGATQTVDATATGGGAIQGLQPDTYYAIEILGEDYQWRESTGGAIRTDMELSVNAGQIWNDIPGPGSLCRVVDGSNQIVYIHTPEAGVPAFKLRVNSESFADNVGQMGWNVYTADAGDSVDPWDGCVTEGYDITALGPIEWIPVVDAAGRAITSSSAGYAEIGGLVPGNMYIVETSRGPWYPSGDQSVGNQEFGAEVSSDGGQTWHAMDGTNPDIMCWEVSQDLKYRKIEITVEEGQSWKIRVADSEDFTDNTGNLAYTLKGLVLPEDTTVTGIINIPGCDVPPMSPGSLAGISLTDLGNYLAGWFDFVSASVISFFAWCPEHTEYIIGLGDEITAHEPFATLDEFDQALNDIRNEINGYNWEANEDYSLLNKSPAESYAMMQEFIFGEIPDDSPWKSGPLVNFEDTQGFEFSESCDLALSDYVGPALGRGVCFATDWAKETGMMFWIQLSLDISIFFACIVSVLKNFRKTVYLFTGVNLDSGSNDAKVFVTNVLGDDSPWKGRRK